MDEALVLVHKDSADQMDFGAGQHMRIGLGVQDSGAGFTHFSVEELAELALALKDVRSHNLCALRIFAEAAARWGLANSEKLCGCCQPSEVQS